VIPRSRITTGYQKSKRNLVYVTGWVLESVLRGRRPRVILIGPVTSTVPSTDLKTAVRSQRQGHTVPAGTAPPPAARRPPAPGTAKAGVNVFALLFLLHHE
jgi:hypothetical protein